MSTLCWGSILVIDKVQNHSHLFSKKCAKYVNNNYAKLTIRHTLLCFMLLSSARNNMALVWFNQKMPQDTESKHDNGIGWNWNGGFDSQLPSRWWALVFLTIYLHVKYLKMRIRIVNIPKLTSKHTLRTTSIFSCRSVFNMISGLLEYMKPFEMIFLTLTNVC